ncbi:unnamed protein product [Linum tenue]|uniref:Uncharacterized protein n=1 Tax=Linum tenue TaxID=586396 RepID=A0AAV0PSE2_9ROSI|nr:unnamed protein product [Linum tenue]
MFCSRSVVLLPMPVNISSGIGISRTVSSPSSLSMFGHNFLMKGGKCRKSEKGEH